MELGTTSLFPLWPMLLWTRAGCAKTKSQRSPACTFCTFCWACLEVWYQQAPNNNWGALFYAKSRWRDEHLLRRKEKLMAISTMALPRAAGQVLMASSEGLQQKSCPETDQPRAWDGLEGQLSTQGSAGKRLLQTDTHQTGQESPQRSPTSLAGEHPADWGKV